MSHDWEGERERMVRAAGEADEAMMVAALDCAAQRAREGDLAAAAAVLQEVRKWAVERGLFKRWDDGIWVFAGIISRVRQMTDMPVPKAYQKLLDAIPSAKYDEDMTRSQRKFWYGSADYDPYTPIGPVGAQPQTAPLPLPARLAIVAVVVVIGYFIFR